MKHSHSILSDGHAYNSPRSLDPTHTRTLTPKLRHSSIPNDPNDLFISTSAHDNNVLVPTANLAMDGAPNDSGPSSSHNTMLFSVDSLIRTLDESLKEPGEHCISIHDIVDAYNMLSRKIHNCSQDITQHPTSVTTPTFQFSEDESTTIFNSLMRDIGRALPSLFETQRPDDSCMDLPALDIDDEDAQQMMEDSLACSYALTLASDILVHPVLCCKFTEDQLVSLFNYILSICTAKDPTIFNMDKHVAQALFILKTQKLPLSVLTSTKDSITSALCASLSENAGGQSGTLNALKAIPDFLREHPMCISWFTPLVPSILHHLNSENTQTSINSALTLAGFASEKMNMASAPDPQIANAIKSYVRQETSKRLPSPAGNSLHSFFKTALHNDSGDGLGPSFALTVLATIVVLLDHTLFSIPECLKFVFLLLQECAISRLETVRAGQREVWKTAFWAFSRIPRSSDLNDDDSKEKSKKERAFRVVAQDLRGSMRLHLLGFLLQPDESKGEASRSDNDVRRAISLVTKLLEKGDNEASQLEAVSILSRMVASIGSPSIKTLQREAGELPFARQIIDGSFLSMARADFNPVPPDVLLECLCPLTEMEVLQHWDAICGTWVPLAQRVLDCGGELSPAMQQIWQALLLVKAELVQGEQFSSSSLFASTIISVMEGFSTKLDVVSSQISYLSFVRKLWTVMKNVFERSWLSFPGEKILAKLLKHQFALSDDRVKESWSQICADLISVGSLDLLRLLHFRDENREEEEITRHLWAVLARNDSTTADKEKSEDLLNLLLMPFGVWTLNAEDDVLWERSFVRLCALGKAKGQGSQDVVSNFLSLCKEPKLDALKKSPKILLCLLEQSTLSASPSCSRTSLQILSWIDDSLSAAYGKAAEKSWALDSLRLIGKVISNTGESDIVKLLCVIQQSLVLWIADEERQLDEQEDQELVDILYMKSLDILARVEPSTTILHDLERFLHSVFLRIRGQGPLVFLKFWRSTYHSRKDVPKHEYPPLIRQCLKAWADVTENSFGDGFSLDSGSQSLLSFTIPDSQMGHIGVDQMGIEFDTPIAFSTDFPPHASNDDPLPDTGYEISAGHLGGFVAPVARQRSTEVEDGNPSASVLSQGRRAEIISRLNSFGPVASSSKRRAESDPPRTPKRPRTEGSQIDTPEPRDKGKGKAYDFEHSIESYANTPSNDSPSKAMDRLSSVSSRRLSQLSRSPSRKKRKLSHSPPLVDDGLPPSSPQAPGHRISEDYDSWEQPMSAKDLKHAQAEMHISSDFVVPDSEELRKAEQDSEEDEKTGVSSSFFRLARLSLTLFVPDHVESDDIDILSPSLGEYPFRSRVRERSQTAPELDHPQTFSPRPAGRLLRRNRTTPADEGKLETPPGQLDVLQHAYAVVADTGASQVDVVDIMQAKRLLNQINLVLDEQMCSKVGPSAHRDEDKKESAS